MALINNASDSPRAQINFMHQILFVWGPGRLGTAELGALQEKRIVHQTRFKYSSSAQEIGGSSLTVRAPSKLKNLNIYDHIAIMLLQRNPAFSISHCKLCTLCNLARYLTVQIITQKILCCMRWAFGSECECL